MNKIFIACLTLSAVTINAAEAEHKKSADIPSFETPADAAKNEAMFPNTANLFKALTSLEPEKTRQEEAATIYQKALIACVSLAQSPETEHLPKTFEIIAPDVALLLTELKRLESVIRANPACKDFNATSASFSAKHQEQWKPILEAPLRREIEQLKATIRDKDYELEQYRAAVCSR